MDKPKRIAIMQPYFFPYIGYFQAIKAVDKYIVYSDLNYIYQGWVDRNQLVDKSGKVFYIRPQLSNSSVSKLISEIVLNKKQYWKDKLVKTLTLLYAGAKYQNDTLKLVNEILSCDAELLCDFNFNLILAISKYLDIDTEIIHEKNKYKQLEEKLRAPSALKSNFPEFANEDYEPRVIRALKMCEIENASTFVNAIGGKELYDKNVFRKHDIELFFIETRPYSYKQFSNIFYPNLSIIDVLMHNGKEGTIEILNNYNLI